MPEQMDYRIGQGVWHPTHWNGVIKDIDWREKHVYVEWYNTGKRDIIDFDELYGNWDWKQKQWQLTIGEYK